VKQLITILVGLIIATGSFAEQNTNTLPVLKAIQSTCVKVKNSPTNLAFLKELESLKDRI
jgi:hypothetical protein